MFPIRTVSCVGALIGFLLYPMVWLVHTASYNITRNMKKSQPNIEFGFKVSSWKAKQIFLAISTALLATRTTNAERKRQSISVDYSKDMAEMTPIDLRDPCEPFTMSIVVVISACSQSICSFKKYCSNQRWEHRALWWQLFITASSLQLSNRLLFGFFHIITQTSDTTYNCVPQFEIMCVVCALRALASVWIITFSVTRTRHDTTCQHGRKQSKKQK